MDFLCDVITTLLPFRLAVARFRIIVGALYFRSCYLWLFLCQLIALIVDWQNTNYVSSSISFRQIIHDSEYRLLKEIRKSTKVFIRAYIIYPMTRSYYDLIRWLLLSVMLAMMHVAINCTFLFHVSFAMYGSTVYVNYYPFVVVAYSIQSRIVSLQ